MLTMHKENSLKHLHLFLPYETRKNIVFAKTFISFTSVCMYVND